jgi:hypothetical protein
VADIHDRLERLSRREEAARRAHYGQLQPVAGAMDDDFAEVLNAVARVVQRHPGLSIMVAAADGRPGRSVIRVSERDGGVETAVVPPPAHAAAPGSEPPPAYEPAEPAGAPTTLDAVVAEPAPAVVSRQPADWRMAPYAPPPAAPPAAAPPAAAAQAGDWERMGQSTVRPAPAQARWPAAEDVPWYEESDWRSALGAPLLGGGPEEPEWPDWRGEPPWRQDPPWQPEAGWRPPARPNDDWPAPPVPAGPPGVPPRPVPTVPISTVPTPAVPTAVPATPAGGVPATPFRPAGQPDLGHLPGQPGYDQLPGSPPSNPYGIPPGQPGFGQLPGQPFAGQGTPVTSPQGVPAQSLPGQGGPRADARQAGEGDQSDVVRTNEHTSEVVARLAQLLREDPSRATGWVRDR